VSTDVVSRGRPRSAAIDERILAVTLDHLRERGYGELSVEQVACAAGVSKASVYRRYRNKADLAAEAIASVSSVRFAQPLPDGTRAALIEHLRRFENGLATVGVGAFGSLLEERDPEVLELHRERTIRPGVKLARSVLQQAQERGEIRTDADLDVAIEMLFGSFFARRLRGRAAPDWPESAVDTLLAGLAR
jgi:AcrR family transcriptional regulator